VTTSRNNLVANPEGLSAMSVLESFATWLDLRLAEATRVGMDLAFRDRPFDIDPERKPPLVGWEHRFIQPGGPEPRGKMWTVYRLHDQTPAQTAKRRMAGGDLTPLLDTLGYLGVFDGERALYCDKTRKR
jgi:hypothetical protein